MQKIWRTDSPYDPLIVMLGIMLLFSIVNMFTVGPTVFNVVVAIVAFVVCGLLIWHAWKIIDLTVVVNKYLSQHNCIEWVDEVTPIFKDGVLRAVTIDLMQYLLANEDGKYSVIYDEVDKRVMVCRFVFNDDMDRVMVVVEYLGQVDVFTN